ncbi:reducing type I polyketide synthase 10 [Jackrogersella minutella]|nr:reducing type I polyketide synthase 10 [Jackrogersella minutella]
MAPLLLSLSSGEESSTSSEIFSDKPLPPAEPIAICGLACRLPGDSYSPRAFWDLISQGRTGQCQVPKSRFNVDAFYHPNGDRPGSVVTQGGYFLGQDVREFENSFFGINNLEALYMDPQQRKLLETVFECLENAGVPMEKASGSNTGVYVGNFTVDYQVMQTRDSDYLERYSATGMGTTILGNRVSHVFNLKGPSLVLDTACSSSLYGLHTACVALQNYECDAAIVAGANLIQSVEQHIGTMKAGVLSATSECHTFDASADGYGRADGIGALYVKRLDDAIRDGDPIRSIVRGTAVNANGKTAGISLPSADGQESVIRKAMAKANVKADDIAYVECHGTGTKVGDAIEVDSISRVFPRNVERPLLIGSVKTNVGHSEAASGISSVIKATMALERGKIPPSYGLKTINPKLKVGERNIHIPTELTNWPSYASRLRCIGINSFGYGGANAHVILEKAPSSPIFQDATALRRMAVHQSSVVLPLSAATEASLESRRADLSKFNFADTNILDLAYTLGSRRSNLPVRGFLVASRSDDIAQSFKEQIFTTGTAASDGASKPLAFVFTGQGSQWAGMCRELFAEFPVFRNAIVEMDAVLRTIAERPSWTLQQAILDAEHPDLIHDAQRSQPCCTAIQIALVQLLASWDIVPATAVGHSSGEIAAAFASGYVSAGEAIVIAYYRGFYASTNEQDGAMMAAGVSEATAVEEISKLELSTQIRVACVNSPEGVTISGDSAGIDQLLAEFQKRSIFARKLKTGGQAYHSHHMLSLGEAYQNQLERILPTLGPSFILPHRTTFVSSVTEQIKTSGFEPSYWRSNLESQVRFSAAVEAINRQGEHYYVELGPHSSLELPVKQILGKAGVANVKYAAPIKRNTNALESALGLAGKLWLYGYNINWSLINGLHAPGSKFFPRGQFRVVTDLPPYRFNYGTMLWSESRTSIEYRQRKYPRHELLGSLVPGGNGNDFIFRNILRLGDISWLTDHKLEETVVFPGAGYLGMAMEAVMQAVDLNRDNEKSLSFRFENVNISNALVLSDSHGAQTEIFTSLQKSPITNASTSSTWWDFTISSYQEGTSVTHAKGSIAIGTERVALDSIYKAPSGLLEPSAKRTWYERMVKEGLNFGPQFQSITEFETPRMKKHSFTSAKAPLLRTCGDVLSVYPIHPITLDAMMQTTIVATTAGRPRDLRAKVPTRFPSITVNTPLTPAGVPCQIHAVAQSTGFGSAEVGAEIVGEDGAILARMDKLRLAPYHAAAKGDAEDTRHPVLRVLWKPDPFGLGPLNNESAQRHFEHFVEEANSQVADSNILKLGSVLDLLAHKNPRLRILELGNDIHDITEAALILLAAKSEFKRASTYTTASFAEDGSLLGGPVNLETGERCTKPGPVAQGAFDLILIPIAGPWLASQMEKIRGLMAKDGSILALCPASISEAITSSDGLSSVSYPVADASLVLAHPQPAKSDEQALKKHKFLIVEREATDLGSALEDALRNIQGQSPSRVTLDALTAQDIPTGTFVFSLCELKSPLLSTISDDHMDRVKLMTDRAASLVWLTNGNTLKGGHPDYALVSGLARSLVLEQPSLQFYTYDLDEPDTDVQATAGHLISTLNQRGGILDREFVQHKGAVHVSRWVPDDGINTLFRAKQGLEMATLALKDAGVVRLGIENVGQFDTLYFKQLEAPAIGPKELRIRVASVGVNAKDFYVLAGRVDTPDATCQLECSGTVEQVGSEVSDFAVGDRVVAMAPTHFQTVQTLPEWACFKLTAEESYDICATLPVPYATAIYALHQRANIRQGESVLIHSGAGGVGIAAIQIAKLAGAEVFTTVSTEDKKKYLVDVLGVKPGNIFSSRDTSFLEDILKATSGRGVDVIINSLTGDQLHATWKCAASFGRFVEIGKLDLSTAGRLEMDQFLKNTTFTAFDLSYLYNSTEERLHEIWNQLLSEVMTLYRAGKIRAIEPLQIFDVAEATQAFRSFSSRARIGRIAINLEKAESEVRVQRLRHQTIFPDKTYIMVGCLGGLGRTISRWMVQRGARKFVFLGRSGLAKPAAQALVQDLEASGAKCVVVKGDICNKEDVDATVAAAEGEIGGVVQAAMGLNEALFTSMSNEYWHTGIDPKVQGTWHLHNSLRASGRDTKLDFFLLTSSISGSVGTATEANYCAANHFLDLFARHRRAQGLPAVSIGLGMISEVGYLHDNPEIEALLKRKGIHAIDADELVQILDLALYSSSENSLPGIHHPTDDLASAHLLTGLEPTGLKELRRQGFEGNNPTLDDPRASLLAHALDGEGDVARHAQDGRLPAGVSKGLQDGLTLNEAVLDHVRRRFGNLVLIKYEAVEVNKSLGDYGMDSMLAAEFRTWFWKNLTVDVPLLMLLGKTCNLVSLSEIAVSQLESDLEE